MKINMHELLKNVGYLGAAVLAAGLLRWYIEETLRLLSRILIGVGGAAFLISVVLNWRAILAYFTRRSTKLGANTLVLISSAVAVLAMLNLLGYRYHKRFDLTAEKLYSLSGQTRQIVSNLQREVRILEFDKRANPQLGDLLPEYRALSSRLGYELIDPQERPEAAQQYSIQRMGEVVVVSGERTERLDEFSEQTITNTILKVTRDANKTICFVEGHGEKSLTSREPDGYGAIEGGLKAENYETRAVNLVAENKVPDDCTVVVVAGPRQAFFPQEAAILLSYLNGGGKLMLLIDPETDPKLDELMKNWNIAVGANTVVDASGVGRLFGTGPAVPLVTTYGTHQISKNFENSMSFFPLARTVSIADSSKFDADTVELLKTSPQSWAETSLARGQVEFNEGQDQRGPVSLGVVAKKKVGEKSARLVVIGDSDFAANRYVGLQLNGSLFLNASNWLAEDEDLISVRPKTPTNRRVTLTQAEQNLLFWFSIIFLPGAVILTGGYIWWKRR